MSRARALYVAIALAIGSGVAWAQTVHTDFNPSANFGSYMTYYWAKTDPMPGNDILNGRIMADVDAGMARRGYTKAPKDQADLAVVVNVSTLPQQKLETFYTGWGGWGWGGWGPYETTVRTYLKGTMVVDLFDAKTKKLVWRGTATDTVSDDPAKNAERVDKSIEKMFGKKFTEED
jgi:uncharacterized protein DUF4136